MPPAVNGHALTRHTLGAVRISFLGNFRHPWTSETHHARSLESLGQKVVRIQEPVFAPGRVLKIASRTDLFIWVHTHGWEQRGMDDVLRQLREIGIPTLTYHLDLWNGLARQTDIRNSPYWQVDYFFTVDRLMAEWLCDNTPVKGRFLPAGVYHRECYISSEPSPHANDVIFVGSRKYHSEWPWRQQLIDFLRDTYGPRFTHIGPDGDSGHLRGPDLNRAYSASKVAVGDTLCPGYTYPWYTSDRLFEAPGRGGFQLFPRITGVDQWFTDGENIRFFDYGDLDGLKALIDHYLENSAERERIRLAGHRHVKQHHTYRHRWAAIAETLEKEGII